MQVNILDAKNALSKLIRLLESGEEGCITIARSNKPVASLVRYEATAATNRIGVARGRVLSADDWDADEINAEVASMFGCGS